jgi:hypothetical protein
MPACPQGSETGRLEALDNNAGISPRGENGKRLDTLTTDLRGAVFHVNVFASAVLARATNWPPPVAPSSA